MIVIIDTPDGEASVIVVTPELAAALKRYTPASSCPKYLRDAWAEAQR